LSFRPRRPRAGKRAVYCVNPLPSGLQRVTKGVELNDSFSFGANEFGSSRFLFLPARQERASVAYPGLGAIGAADALAFSGGKAMATKLSAQNAAAIAQTGAAGGLLSAAGNTVTCDLNSAVSVSVNDSTVTQWARLVLTQRNGTVLAEMDLCGISTALLLACIVSNTH
jgi:hypothetical protein